MPSFVASICPSGDVPMTIRWLRLGLLTLSLMVAKGQPSPGQNLSPAQAVERMVLAKGLKASAVAAEPLVRQPVAIDFDDRGRLWAIQYLQYPNPAGLNRTKVDRYSRTVYDRVPEPPPKGPKGADRLTILEDTDGDGMADKARDFVTGLNLSTGFAFGDGGVYVLQAPYLLHYADADGDDVPDGDPRVLLAGFGMEDAHSLANSLTWGEDGWLYGLQGSTVTAKIRGIEFQQGIWRYHPPTDRFELFAEGGGNMWGLDFDEAGNLFASTNFGPHVALHVMQDAYYWKQFGKHGPLHNPYTFGHFDHMPHGGAHGGHVTAGGLFYLADRWPAEFRGRYIGANVLSHLIAEHVFEPKGATFSSRQAGIVLDSRDPWFAPCDQVLGPDGNVYVADWHDQRMAHPDPDADWDRTNGRIYAIRAAGDDRPTLSVRPDLAKKSSVELIGLLRDPNAFISRRARRILKERYEEPAVKRLNQVWHDRDLPVEFRREAFRTLVSMIDRDPANPAPLSADDFRSAVADTDPAIRRLAVQALGDFAVMPAAGRVAAIATPDSDLICLGQRIASVARVEDPQAIDGWARLASAVDDANDPTLDQRYWWAVERISQRDPAGIVDAIVSKSITNAAGQEKPLTSSEIVAEKVIGNLIRKYCYLGGNDIEPLVVRLVRLDVDRHLPFVLEAFRGGAPKPAGAFRLALTEICRDGQGDLIRWEIAARLGIEEARIAAKAEVMRDRGSLESKRFVAYLRTAADSGWADWSDICLVASRNENAAIAEAAWAGLSRLADDKTARKLVDEYSKSSQDRKKRTRAVLSARAETCATMLEAVAAGKIPRNDFALPELAAIARLGSESIDQKILKIWGKIAQATPEERLAEVRRLNNDLRAASGDAKIGRDLFAKVCAGCHRLYDVGKLVGPDLTGATRSDRDWLLTSIVDPSGVIRKEYQSRIIEMNDGRVLEGLLVESSGGLWKLAKSDGTVESLPASEIRESRESAVSVMPEGLYRQFDPQQLRDLFAFLQSLENAP
ncbi:c-type cytochrome [bacterium]|nr:c-type cytochrome [bacterium]